MSHGETGREWLDRFAADATEGYSRERDMKLAERASEFDRGWRERIAGPDEVDAWAGYGHFPSDMDLVWTDDAFLRGNPLYRYPDERWIT